MEGNKWQRIKSDMKGLWVQVGLKEAREGR